VTIIDSISEPRLGLAEHFGGDSFKAWRTFLQAAFGLEVTDPALYTLCTGRTDAPDRARECWALVGRR
jgi:hypothetical protein